MNKRKRKNKKVGLEIFGFRKMTKKQAYKYGKEAAEALKRI